MAATELEYQGILH